MFLSFSYQHRDHKSLQIIWFLHYSVKWSISYAVYEWIIAMKCSMSFFIFRFWFYYCNEFQCQFFDNITNICQIFFKMHFPVRVAICRYAVCTTNCYDYKALNCFIDQPTKTHNNLAFALLYNEHVNIIIIIITSLGGGGVKNTIWHYTIMLTIL